MSSKLDLKDLNNQDLEKKLKDLKKELLDMKIQNKLGQLENISGIKNTRRNIARIKTILNNKDDNK